MLFFENIFLVIFPCCEYKLYTVDAPNCIIILFQNSDLNIMVLHVDMVAWPQKKLIVYIDLIASVTS